jgi:hypothetical protein
MTTACARNRGGDDGQPSMKPVTRSARPAAAARTAPPAAAATPAREAAPSSRRSSRGRGPRPRGPGAWSSARASGCPPAASPHASSSSASRSQGRRLAVAEPEPEPAFWTAAPSPRAATSCSWASRRRRRLPRRGPSQATAPRTRTAPPRSPLRPMDSLPLSARFGVALLSGGVWEWEVEWTKRFSCSTNRSTGRGEYIYRRGRVRSRLREASRARQPRCVCEPRGRQQQQ